MPDLADVALQHANAVYWGRLLFGMPTGAFVPSALLITLARLADQAIQEYMAARADMLAHFRRRVGADASHYFRATNHMEAFVGTLWRSVGIGEAARRTKEGPHIPRDQLPTRDEWQRLNAIRRAIQHMDARIRDARIRPGDPTMLMMGDHSVRLEEVEIGYDELAWWVTQMSSLVLVLRAEEEAHPSPEWPGVLTMFAEALTKHRDAYQ